jgi:hypothetical protein
MLVINQFDNLPLNIINGYCTHFWIAYLANIDNLRGLNLKKKPTHQLYEKSSVWNNVDKFFPFERTFGPWFDTENILVGSRRCFPFFPVISNGYHLTNLKKTGKRFKK